MATATFTNNTIQGSCVAGIRVAGTVTATGNQLEGLAVITYGPPNFAVWALEGASVTLSRNQISTWKHALFATAATVNANRNTVLNFYQIALVVNNAPQPANVLGNIAVSQNPEDKVLVPQGATGKVTNNELRSEAP